MSMPKEEDLSYRVSELEAAIKLLKDRNKRVESDKDWETSKTRIFILVLTTFFMTALVFWLIEIPNPLLNALIPTVAYLLSTQTLPVVKQWWLRSRVL